MARKQQDGGGRSGLNINPNARLDTSQIIDNRTGAVVDPLTAPLTPSRQSPSAKTPDAMGTYLADNDPRTRNIPRSGRGSAQHIMAAPTHPAAAAAAAPPAAAPASDWGNPSDSDYAQQHIVTINIHGVKVQVNENIATQTEGFLEELWQAGYRFKSVQGYNNRNIAGSSSKSNHAFGAAFDIDPPKNPRYGDGKGGSFALPANVGAIAAKYGFVWGGNYQSSKDYMHFEAATAPATPKNLGLAVVGASAGGGRGMSAATGTTASAPAKPMTNQQIRDYVISHYGYAASYLHDKEIGPILLDAAKRGLGPDELRGKLQATKWWKTHTDAQIKWDSLNEQDPAEAKSRVAGSMATIDDAAKQAGISLTRLQVHDLAVLYNRNGWNDTQLNNAMRYQAKIDPNVTQANLGPYASLAATNPEIKALVAQAGANGWSQARFEQAVQGTNWWRTTPTATRVAQLGVVNDPAAEAATHKAMHDKVVVASRNLGVPQTDAVNQLGEQAYLNGWSDEEINRHLSDLIHLAPGGAGATGQTAVTVASLKQQAAQYLVPLSDQTLGQWVSQIQRGDVPAASFDAYLKDMAKTARPWAAKQIDAGQTVAQIVDPYRQLIASTLELPPDQVDFNNPRFSQILDGAPQQGQTGSAMHGPMSLSQAGQYLRGLDDYKKTSDGIDKAAQFATLLNKTFAATT